MLDAAIESVVGDPGSGFVLQPEEDVNDSQSWYYRAGLRWQPTDTIDVQLTYQHEDQEQDDQQVANPDWVGGDIELSVSLPGQLIPHNPIFERPNLYPNGKTPFPANGKYDQSTTIHEPYERDLDLVSLDLNVDFGLATVTSSTSYYENHENYERDDTGFYEKPLDEGGYPLSYGYGYFPRMLFTATHDTVEERFVEEVRIISNWDKRFDYVAGFFFQKLENNWKHNEFTPGMNAFIDADPVGFIANDAGFPAQNPNLATHRDVYVDLVRKFAFEDRSLFGELTYHLTDDWQITGGARAFWHDFEVDYTIQFPFFGVALASDGVNPLGGLTVSEASDLQDQIFKVNTSYKMNENSMVYFTWSEGFRRGGTNPIADVGQFASLKERQPYEPDKATNWEIGIKGTLSDRMTYTVAGFHIDWDNFQFDDFTTIGFQAVLNGTKAVSQGIEIELNGLIGEGLSYSLGYNYTDARVDESFGILDLNYGALLVDPPAPPVVAYSGDKGDPLPGSIKHIATLSLDYLQPLKHQDWTVNYHLNGFYRSSTQSTFSPTAANGRFYFDIEGFSIWDASVTLSTGNWSATAFVDNVFNEYGLTGGIPAGVNNARVAQFWVTRPRTAGLAVGYSFF